jgi:hypothetical protein
MRERNAGLFVSVSERAMSLAPIFGQPGVGAGGPCDGYLSPRLA